MSSKGVCHKLVLKKSFINNKCINYYRFFEPRRGTGISRRPIAKKVFYDLVQSVQIDAVGSSS